MAFKPTDLPCPVAPATKRCGSLAKSNINVSPVIVFPNATGSSALNSRNFLSLRTLSIDTICGFRFGTSIPIVPFPGIGAIIRIPKAFNESAMSSSRFFIFAMRTPRAGVISYKVTVGPTVAVIPEISTPKLRRLFIIRSSFAFCSALSTEALLFS